MLRSRPLPPPAATRRRLREVLAGFVLVASLALVACDSGNASDGEGDAPFVGIADRLSLAGSEIALPVVESPTDATPESNAPTTGEARIGNTGGDGVALRNECADGARVGGAWAEGTTIEVVELGTGECEGWSSGRAAGVTSWVRNDYLVGLSEGEGAPVVLPGGPEVTLRGWFAELLDGSGRVALLARRPLGEPTPELTMTSLRYVVEDMEALASAASAAGPFTGTCEQARAGLAEAAATLRNLADGIATAIETSGAIEPLDAAANTYIEQQAGAAEALNSCAGT